MTKERKIAYRRDLLLAGVLLLAAVAVFMTVRNRQIGDTGIGPVAVVSLNGQEAGRYPLSQDGVFQLNGGSNTLVVSNGEAWVSEANCPDKVCMGMGKISRNGEFIACLPNRLIINVEGGDGLTPDAVT